MSEIAKLHWAIVGGGFLGLTLAHRLAQHGQRVTVFEAAPHLGGLASAWQVGDLVWDRYYHVTLLSDLNLRRILAELDLETELQWRTTRTGFYQAGCLYPLDDAIDYMRLPVLDIVDKIRLAATILYASRISDGRRLEKISAADWLTKLSGAGVFDKVWLPLLRAKLGDNYKQTSAAFIWAVIRRLYAARRSGLKREMFGYVPGGYARVLERFSQKLRQDGVSIQLGCSVRRVDGDGLGLTVKSSIGDLPFDRVVVTLAAPLSANICCGLSAEEKHRLQGIVYQGVICASMLLKRPLTGQYLTYITDENIPFTAVVQMSALVDPDQFAHRGLVYLPRYVTMQDPYWKKCDEEIKDRFVAVLFQMYPFLDKHDVLFFRVSRARQVLAISTLDYSERLPSMTTSVPGLYVINSAQIVNGTLNVNDTIGLAENSVPLLLQTLSETSAQHRARQRVA